MKSSTNVFTGTETDFEDAGSELDMTIYASAISSDWQNKQTNRQ